MVKPSYRTPKQAHQSRRDLPPGGKEYFAQLIKAKSEPEKHGMPICYRHIEDLAQSISRRGVTESVLVLLSRGLLTQTRLVPTCSVASYANGTVRDRDSTLWSSSYKAYR